MHNQTAQQRIALYTIARYTAQHKRTQSPTVYTDSAHGYYWLLGYQHARKGMHMVPVYVPYGVHAYTAGYNRALRYGTLPKQ